MTNCYHIYPAHAAFGGYKQSGVGRETHKMALNAYQHEKPAGELRYGASGSVLIGNVSYLF